MSAMLKRFGLDFVIYAAAKIGVMLSTFLVIKILSAHLLPTEYGAYGLIGATITTTVILSSTFLMTSILRYLPRALEKRRMRSFKYVTTQIGQLTLGVTAGLSLVAISLLYTTGAVVITPFLVLAIIAASVGAVILQIYPSYLNAMRDRSRYSSAVTLQSSLFVAGLAFGLGVFPDRVATIFWVLAISQSALYFVARPRLRFIRKIIPQTWATLREYRQYGLPIVLLHVSIQMNSTLDQYIIRLFGDLHSVGLYAANYTLGEKAIYGLSSITALAVTPYLFRQWESGQQSECFITIWRFFFLSFGAGAVIVGIFAMWSGPLASYVLAPHYLEGAAILPFVTCGAVCLGATAIMAEVFTLKERTLELALCYLSAAGVNLLSNLLFVPKLGYMGAAYSTLVTYIYLMIVILWRAHALVAMFRYLPAAFGFQNSSPGEDAEL